MMRWVYWTGWMTLGSAFRGLFSLRVRGKENLVTDGSVLVVSNHQSFLDPPLIGTLYDDEMYYLARKSLFRGPAKWLYTQWKAIPVDQNRPDMTSLKTIIRLLKQGDRVLVFPEGERTKNGELGEAQAGVGLIAMKSGAVIQPIRIRGARRALPRGSGKIRFARIDVHVGPPVTFTEEELSKTTGKARYKMVADRIMEAIAKL